MKMLILARHAKSSWAYPELEDFERPLNRRGRKDAPKMAAKLVQLKIQPDLIWASPANRAVITARIYANALHYPLNEIHYSEVLYSDASIDLFNYIKRTPDTFKQILLMGHNPVMTELANYLVKKKVENIPTAGIIGVTFEIDRWERLKNGTGTIKFLEFPKKKS
jgi:phosphohistidine phosphatase